MKQVLFLLLFGTLLFSEAKTGWLDMQKALTSVNEGKKILGNLESEVIRNKKELDTEQESIQKMKVDFDKKSMVMNEKSKRDKQLEIQSRVLKLQEKYMKYQQDLQAKQAQASQEIMSKINIIVEEYAQKNGFSYIFEKNALIYKPAADEITEKIIALYDKKHK